MKEERILKLKERLTRKKDRNVMKKIDLKMRLEKLSGKDKDKKESTNKKPKRIELELSIKRKEKNMNKKSRKKRKDAKQKWIREDWSMKKE